MNLLKTGILFLFSALTLNVASCSNGTMNSSPNVGDAREGKIITTKFLSTNSGTFINPEANGELSIASDGSIKYVGTFQVGEDKGTVPYPTVCRYSEIGNITNVYERSAQAKAEYMEYASHMMMVSFSKVELDRTSKDNDSLAHCEAFEKEQNSRIPMNFNFYSEVISANHIRLHNSGGADYKKGGPRTPSTLDENFYRQGSPELEAAQKPDKPSN